MAVLAAQVATPPLPPSQLRSFATAADLRSAMASEQAWCGVVFEAGPPHWSYRILSNGTYSPDTAEANQAGQETKDGEGEWSKYLDSGIALIQRYVDGAILLSQNASAAKDIVSLKRGKIFDNPNSDTPPWVLQWLVGWTINIGNMFAFNAMLNQVYLETKSDFDRSLRLVGVYSTAYWMHWLVSFLPGIAVRAVLHAGVAFLVKHAVYSDFGLLLIFFLLFQLTLALVALTASRFSNHVSPSSVGLAATFSFSCAYIAVLVQDDVSSGLVALLAWTNPWFASHAGGAILVTWDGYTRHVGLSAGNAWDSGFAQVLLAQCGSVVLWAGCCAYAFHLDWQAGTASGHAPPVPSEGQRVRRANEEEVSTQSGHRRVRGRGMRKVYGSGPEAAVALDGLDLELYEGEVFGLLGLNGAGKSTAISILSGELAPTEGAVSYELQDGAEVPFHQDSDTIRASIGVCLQKDALVDTLSVREHLHFFCNLKGIFGPEAEVEVQEKLQECALEAEADKMAADCSGGNRRKLSLAIALLGDPKVLFLDEPTAGMDPLSRRRVWDTVMAAKVGRAVVLTTHLMEEAEMLSSRIGIVKAGKMVACGSSLFLKHKFGAGYTVSCSGSKRTVDSVVQQHMPGAKASQSASAQGSWELSVPLDKSATLPRLLSGLEATCGDVGLQLTTLEEVFIKIADSNTETDSSFGDKAHDGEVGSVWEDGLPTALAEVIWPPTTPVREASSWQRMLVVAELAHRDFVAYPISWFFGIVYPLIMIVLAFGIGATVGPDGPVMPDTFAVSASTITQSSGPVSVFGVDRGVAGAGGLVTGEAAAYTDDVEAERGFWLGGVREVGGGFEVEFNVSVPGSVVIMQGLVANVSLASLDPPQSVSTVLEPQEYTEPTLVDVAALLIPLLSATGFLTLSFVLLQAATWATRKCSLLLRLMGVSLAEQYAGQSLQRVVGAFLPCLVVCLISAAAAGSPVIGSGGRWLVWVLLMVSYAAASLALALCALPLFKSETIVQELFPTALNLITILPFLAIWILTSQDDEDAQDTGRTLADILSIIPTIAYQRGMQELLTSDHKFAPVTTSDSFGWEMRVIHSVVLLLVVTAISTVIILHQSSGATSSCPPGWPTGDEEENASKDEEKMIRDAESAGGDDPDVVAGRVLAEEGKDKGGIAVVGLSKRFPGNAGKQHKMAVDDLALSAQPAEICAVLGPNGAGKTTTLRMITGDLRPSSGALYLDGTTVALDRGEQGLKHAYREGLMGYCPQFESTFEGTTLWGHLVAVARLKGLDARAAEKQAQAIAKVLDLEKFRDRRAEQLSIGNQKKLNLAMAVLGNPKVLLLDEPSTGLDPFSRRRMWKLLKPGGAAGTRTSAMLISTHYMDEAAFLASRVVIMVAGAVKACGSPAHLIQRYCSRTAIDLVVASDAPASALSDLEAFLLSRLPHGTKVRAFTIEDLHELTAIDGHHCFVLTQFDCIAVRRRLWRKSVRDSRWRRRCRRWDRA
mmetsp:Transcript_14099/g.29191  ORF Transcript_14099/g.29191 Transcript_14099/m.29191 type:complete len:1490 (+) Transcript_14099:497-4966(+)